MLLAYASASEEVGLVPSPNPEAVEEVLEEPAPPTESAAAIEDAKAAAAVHATEATAAAAKLHAAVTQHGFYVDTVVPFWEGEVAPLVRTYLGSSVCDFLSKLETYIADVAEMLHGVDVAALHEHVVAGTLAATSGLIAGGCLVLAPIVFGVEWLTYVLTLLGGIVGLVGSTMLLEPSGLFGVRLEILMSGSAKCVATLVIQLGAAYTLANLINGIRHIAYFGIGAVGAGYGSYLVSEAVVGIMTQVEFITRYVDVSAITEHEILMACGILALIGGLLFGRYHDALIDMALGLLGGALMAQGLITIALADLISEERAAQLKVEQYYLYYVAGIALLIECVRSCIVSARERAAGQWHPSPRRVGSPRRGLVSSSPMSADSFSKAKELSKRTPSKKEMH